MLKKAFFLTADHSHLHRKRIIMGDSSFLESIGLGQKAGFRNKETLLWLTEILKNKDHFRAL